MATFLHVLLIVAIVLVGLFGLSFIVYFFNLDMKLMAAIEPLISKHYDKIKKRFPSMKLYDEIISDILKSLDGYDIQKLPVGNNADPISRDWQDAGKAMMILQSDMAYELGGHNLPALGNTLVTTEPNLVPHDEIILIGKDLPEITTDTPYARIAIVRVAKDYIETGNKLYNTIQNIGYFRYHIYPLGFMLRVSSSNDRESVRVATKALEMGLNFTAIGNVMQKALHLHKEVEAVKIIFVTNPNVDYAKLQYDLKKTKQVTATIDHILKDVNMDCKTCGLKEICDEVEELREMHFGTSKENI